MRCPQCGQKDCCGADMSPEIERLTAELAEMIEERKRLTESVSIILKACDRIRGERNNAQQKVAALAAKGE